MRIFLSKIVLITIDLFTIFHLLSESQNTIWFSSRNSKIVSLHLAIFPFIVFPRRILSKDSQLGDFPLCCLSRVRMSLDREHPERFWTNHLTRTLVFSDGFWTAVRVRAGKLLLFSRCQCLQRLYKTCPAFEELKVNVCIMCVYSDMFIHLVRRVNVIRIVNPCESVKYSKSAKMGRSCCVQECKSGKIVPSHGIPANKERRKQWLHILKVNITDENVIKQLRICHKHFHGKDYSCCPTYRRLANTAVPCIALECPEEHWSDPGLGKIIFLLTKLN